MPETNIHFLGHATVLIEHAGTRVVIDPNFSDAVPFLRRKIPARFDPLEIHNTDAVLFTNPRLNRLDTASFKFFKQRHTRLFVQKGLGAHLNRFFTFEVTEIEADQEFSIGAFTILPLATRHLSSRFFKNHTTSLNYLIKSPGSTVFYVSDMRYDHTFFNLIGEQYHIDVAVLPIDFQSLRSLNRGNFMSVTDAVNACRDLKAEKMLPVAYGAFAWRGKNPMSGLDSLRKELENEHSLKERVAILEPGDVLHLGTANVENHSQPALDSTRTDGQAEVIELRRGS